MLETKGCTVFWSFQVNFRKVHLEDSKFRKPLTGYPWTIRFDCPKFLILFIDFFHVSIFYVRFQTESWNFGREISAACQASDCNDAVMTVTRLGQPCTCEFWKTLPSAGYLQPSMNHSPKVSTNDRMTHRYLRSFFCHFWRALWKPHGRSFADSTWLLWVRAKYLFNQKNKKGNRETFTSNRPFRLATTVRL